jgi:hypothetical protein
MYTIEYQYSILKDKKMDFLKCPHLIVPDLKGESVKVNTGILAVLIFLFFPEQ